MSASPTPAADVGPLSMRDPRDAGVALFQRFPSLVEKLPWAPIGNFPTAVESLSSLASIAGDQPSPSPLADVWVKREDRSADGYGGNKVRTIEGHIGRALHRGSQRIWATGAFGSNHALCTAIHAPRLGLLVGVSLFPQPPLPTARANLRATLATSPAIFPMPHAALIPWALARLMARRGESTMTPGGAIPLGALGHVSAGLELAGQMASGECPPFRHVVLAVGSTCTSAGLLVGLHLASGLGIGPTRPPHVNAIRVGPWPISSKTAILWLARRTHRFLEGVLGQQLPIDRRGLATGITSHGGYLGRGYGFPTAGGSAAAKAFSQAGGPPLDDVYTAKSGAGLLALRTLDGPHVYWATKSSWPLATVTSEQLAHATPQMRAWLARPAIPQERAP